MLSDTLRVRMDKEGGRQSSTYSIETEQMCEQFHALATLG
jgi:hypothetical protein